MTPEATFAQLRSLATSVPNLSKQPVDVTDSDLLTWLGRLSAVVEGQKTGLDAASLALAIKRLWTMDQDRAVAEIMVILHRALARAEAKAPVTSQGSFVAAGNAFDALAAIAKIMAEARTSIRIIDPYLDERVLIDFAAMASEGVRLELLSDANSVKGGLKPAVTAWILQHNSKRPLEAKLAPARTLHDRLIVIDNSEVWDLSQSIKDFAGRSPASASRADTELAGMKIAAYEAIWQAAAPI